MLRRDSRVHATNLEVENVTRHGMMKMMPMLVVLPLATLGGVVGMPVPECGALPNTEVATNIVARLDQAVLESVDFAFS